MIKHLQLPRLFRVTPKVDVYLSLNDPCSYMLVQALEELTQRFSIQFKLYLVYQALPGVTIAPKLMRVWALKDANCIAQQYNFKTIKDYPTTNALLTGQQMWQLSTQDITSAVTIFHQTWLDQFENYYSNSTPVINFQIKNLERLEEQGHYLPGTLCFAGEWFLGVERLGYLEHKLTALGFNIGQTKAKYWLEPRQFEPNKKIHQEQDIAACEVFISLRSPYSYLGFIKVKRMAQHYGMPIIIKPVLPLMMRGLNVPLTKQKYLYLDAHREALSAGIAFDGYADPIGQGIINCYQLFSYAEAQNKALSYIEAAFEAIYVQGLDVANIEVIQGICQRIGLDYHQAISYANAHDWQQWVDNNQIAMDDMGFWGVPCFRFQDTICWGQDRLFLIEQAMLQTLNQPRSNAIS